MGGLDADCHGLLIAWNQTPGWVGDLVDHKEVKMTDCSFIANKCGRIVPDEKTITRSGPSRAADLRFGSALRADEV